MIKYILFFLAVFVLFIFIAEYFLMHSSGASAGVVGWWMDYEDSSISPITVFKTNIGYYRHEKLCEVNGHWTNKMFYGSLPSNPSEEVVVAKELPNEDLEMYLKYFDPEDSRTITCVKNMRTSEEYHPYPVRVPGQKVKYPPPKGMIQVGMLQTDLENLPWEAYSTGPTPAMHQEMMLNGNLNSYHGSTFFNAWPALHLYKSDDPNLPELRVTTEKGRVIQVVGGAEDAPGPSYVPPPDTSSGDQAVDDSENSNSTWTEWLFNLIFRK